MHTWTMLRERARSLVCTGSEGTSRWDTQPRLYDAYPLGGKPCEPIRALNSTKATDNKRKLVYRAAKIVA